MSRVKLTKRGRYAVAAMMEIAKASLENPAPLSDVAKKCGISLSYMEQLMTGLRLHGLVKSYRGPGGGYSLARPSSEIPVAKILAAAEDSMSTRKKKSGADTVETSGCQPSQALWTYIEAQLYALLLDISLADVLNGQLDGF